MRSVRLAALSDTIASNSVMVIKSESSREGSLLDSSRASNVAGTQTCNRKIPVLEFGYAEVSDP
jgi:hypothetical protein